MLRCYCYLLLLRGGIKTGFSYRFWQAATTLAAFVRRAGTVIRRAWRHYGEKIKETTRRQARPPTESPEPRQQSHYHAIDCAEHQLARRLEEERKNSELEEFLDALNDPDLSDDSDDAPAAVHRAGPREDPLGIERPPLPRG